jgi:hypothetical protein
LQNGIGYLRSLGAWDEVWEVFARKHGALARFVVPTLEEILRRDGIAALRGSIEDVEHRFFLALLLNVPDRAGILEMVAQRHPGDSVGTILRWAEEMAEESEGGTWILDAVFPWDVDADEVDSSKVFLAALRYFLAGGALPGELEELSAEEVAALRDAFARSSWRALLGATATQ